LASGTIAAGMGTFLVTYPHDQIKSILILGWFARITFIPAAVLTGVWFVIQLFNAGTVVSHQQIQQGGVAYLAHIGGMIFGAVLDGSTRIRGSCSNKTVYSATKPHPQDEQRRAELAPARASEFIGSCNSRWDRPHERFTRGRLGEAGDAVRPPTP